MSRPWRIEYEGALYHVLSRGNDRSNIFKNDRDRYMFLDLLEDMTERYDVNIFAFVLMNNHYHLLLRTNLANLSKSMQWLGVTYTRRFNNRHRRTGHLFHGRFKSILVENDAYLFRLSYYIHRNPLRACLVKRLADYKWSSYRSYAYGWIRYDWLDTDLILSQLENTPDPFKAYKANVQAYAKEEELFWEDLKHGLILGSKNFSEVVKKQYLPDIPHKEIPQQKQLEQDQSIVAVLSKAAAVFDCDVGSLRRAKRLSGENLLKRDILLYLLYQNGAWTNQQIADLFNIAYTTVSRRVHLLKEQLKSDEKLSDQMTAAYALIKM